MVEFYFISLLLILYLFTASVGSTTVIKQVEPEDFVISSTIFNSVMAASPGLFDPEEIFKPQILFSF